jgi:cytochrome c556
VKPLAMTLVVVLALSGLAGAAAAAPRLKAIMHDWKADAASAEQMLAGRGAYDSAEMSRILQAFISDSQDLEARASGASAAALDIKARFASFESKAKAALDTVGAQDQVRKRFAQVRGECRSCHDVCAN